MLFLKFGSAIEKKYVGRAFKCLCKQAGKPHGRIGTNRKSFFPNPKNPLRLYVFARESFSGFAGLRTYLIEAGYPTRYVQKILVLRPANNGNLYPRFCKIYIRPEEVESGAPGKSFL